MLMLLVNSLVLDVGAGFTSKFHIPQTIYINPPLSLGRVSVHLSVGSNRYRKTRPCR
jgi:hypothetical protein